MSSGFRKNQLGHYRSLVLVFLCLALYSCSETPRSSVSGGPVSTLFTMAFPGIDGQIIDFRAFQGKVVVLDFFASWCEPCKDTAPLMERVYQNYQSQGVVVVGISLDTPGNRDAVRRFAERHGMQFPVLVDDGRIRDVTGVFSVPTTMVLDQSGMVRAKIMGARRDLYDRVSREIDSLR